MAISLATLDELLRRARCPADIFGPLGADPPAALHRRYRELAAAPHPDRHPADAAAAHRAFTALQRWHALALQQLAAGTYAAPPPIEVAVGGRRYHGHAEPLQGDLCELYPVSAGDGPLLLKIARRPRDNDLLAAESRALAALDQGLRGQAVRAHFPTLVDSFLLADAAGVRRHANVLRREPGVLTLAEVLDARPAGLDPADAAWIFNRILAALGTAHALGLVHGAVLPAHILVRPADHNAILIDWCYSVASGDPLRAIAPASAADYPPEVLAKRPATPATDLYMAARCMVRLLGGAGDTATLPARTPPPLRALLRACLIPAPHRRPGDAWQLFDDLQTILRDRYGPPVFRPFPLSA